jgi:hypothetical protein
VTFEVWEWRIGGGRFSYSRKQSHFVWYWEMSLFLSFVETNPFSWVRCWEISTVVPFWFELECRR